MKTQIRPASGQSFWNLTDVSWEASICGKPDLSECPWVEWQGRTWLCKRRNKSICEIVGYHIAEALELPLQPWMAFFQSKNSGRLAPGSGAGILVERWEQRHREASCICYPAGTHPDLVSRALALEVLDRGDSPEWLVNEDETELRLCDLEFIGPFLRWPPQTTGFRYYGEATGDRLGEVSEIAWQIGALESLEKHLKNLSTMDFSPILDFSGHPYAETMKKPLLRGLEARQKELRRLV